MPRGSEPGDQTPTFTAPHRRSISKFFSVPPELHVSVLLLVVNKARVKLCYNGRITSDLRFALRLGLARRSGAPLLVAALFAAGVGLASGMWAVVDAALLRPLPFRDGGALVAVMERTLSAAS